MWAQVLEGAPWGKVCAHDLALAPRGWQGCGSHVPNERARVCCRAQTWPSSMEGCRGRAAPQRSPSEGAQAASLQGGCSLHAAELLAAAAPSRDAQCGLRRSECAVSPRPRSGASVSLAPGRPCPGASLALVGSTLALEQRAQSPQTLGVHLRPSGSQARPHPPPAPSGRSLEPPGRRPQLYSTDTAGAGRRSFLVRG